MTPQIKIGQRLCFDTEGAFADHQFYALSAPTWTLLQAARKAWGGIDALDVVMAYAADGFDLVYTIRCPDLHTEYPARKNVRIWSDMKTGIGVLLIDREGNTEGKQEFDALIAAMDREKLSAP